MRKLDLKNVLKPRKHLYSERHALADEISVFFKEPKKFAMYLGILKKIGVRAGRRIFSEVRHSDAKKPVRLFMYKVKQHNLMLKAKHGKTLAGNRKT